MITKQDAMTKHSFEHVSLKNADGSPLRARASGKCQVWKTRPLEFRLPCKYGLYQSFYITERNVDEWNAVG